MLNINIENEYSRLKTVILGIADNLGNPPSESDAFDPRSLYHIKNNSYPLEKDLKKEVDIGANGTQSYIIKQGTNKGKVIHAFK